MMKFLPLCAALLTPAQPLVDANVLEESVRNEVEHALARIPTNCVAFAELPREARLAFQTNDFFGTNGLSRTDCAIKFVSSQRADGRWFHGTNDVTHVVREILKALEE